MRIVQEVVDRGLVAGDRLPLETEMMATYQVSRASLREALRLLEVLGLISLRPGRGGGPTVGSVRPEYVARTATLYFGLGGTTFKDLFAAHLLLEVETSALAAANPDRALVEATLSPFLERATDVDVRERQAEYRGFHRAIRDLGRNPVFSLFGHAIAHVVTTHVLASMEPVQLREQIDREHIELARLIIDGNVAGARDLTQSHFQSQLDYYIEHWPRRFLEPIEWR